MKSFLVLSSAFIFVMLLSFQCKRETACTMEFRTVGIQVIGDPLDDFYTIRNLNGDTLRYENYGFEDNYYIILDDNFHVYLKNSSENFTFIGIINGEKVVDEAFVIRGDDCHIEKVSGAVTVYL
jgi:hypothetical protein